jgi:hypothetical protein
MGAKHLFSQARTEEPHCRFYLNPDRELVFPDIWKRDDLLMEASTGKGGIRK